MLNYLIYCTTGLLLGTITGLTPGLHVNTVCIVGLSIYRRFGANEMEFALAMVCMSVTHTFLDYFYEDESVNTKPIPWHYSQWRSYY